MAEYKHNHPGQKEPRSHGETHHEDRVVDLNTASEKEIEDLPMVGRERAPSPGRMSSACPASMAAWSTT